MESPISKSVFFSYLSGQATPIEAQSVDEWIKNPANQEHFFALLLEWEREHAQFSPDPEQAIADFRIRTENPEPDFSSEAGIRTRKVSVSRLAAIAACIVLLLTAGWFLRNDIRYRTIRAPYGEIVQHELPDGSKVTLNANSSLCFPRFGFGRKTREVWLDGEARFSVVHAPEDQQFLVKTQNDLEVAVLGTEFSVFTRTRGAKVVLSSGRIRIDYEKEGHSAILLMKPGEVLTRDSQGEMQIDTTERPEEHSAWKDGRFVFDATPVSDICHLLEENFGVIVQPATVEIANRTISGNFETRTSGELLEILREVFSLKTATRRDTLVLY
jgi:transmembrane sensor